MSAIDTLRFTTAGSVDDGKSTLIGRLLYDTKSILEDQLAAIESTTAKRWGAGVDLSLLTDGLTAEREQGITIDVAYRYFTGPKRRFIIADTPGHEQYTRNMVTGASTADLSIILVDASKGLQTQSRRHAILAALLGIPHVVVAINKMDLAGYSQVIFEAIRRDFLAFAAPLGIAKLDFIPVSALKGDMVVERGHALHWHDGPTLLELLETTDAPQRRVGGLRFPVQRVATTKFPGTHGIELRGYQGRIESGRVRVGDTIAVLPARHSATVSDIVTLDGRLDEAAAPLSVTLLLDRQLDISRGDLFTHIEEPPQVSNRIVADVCWFGDSALDRSRRYLLKHGTQSVRVAIDGIEHKLDVNTLKRDGAVTLQLNDIGRLRLKTLRPLAFDRYADNRANGSFILIDEVSNATVAGGLIARVNHG